MRTCIGLALIIVALASPGWAFEATAKTVRDGDSLTVSGPEGVLVNIRLYGIDAPEYKQAYGYQARKSLSKLLGRKTVQIEPQDTDRYGRTVALVRLPDGTLVNEIMVVEGHAWVYPQYCRQEELCRRLLELEEQARLDKRGLWAENDPERPGDWRKNHKTEEWYKAPVRAMKTIGKKMKSVLGR